MSFSNLPDDIQVDIFLRVPVKSILACKFLCKRWFTLLSNPKFVKDHLHLTRKTKDNTRLMLSRYKPKSNTPLISSIDYASILPLSSSSEYKCDWDVLMDHPFQQKKEVWGLGILGSCNGLVCLGVVSGNMNAYRIYIWNPSTKQHKQILSQKTLECDAYSRYNWSNFRYGFGYDENMDDYKVVCIPYSTDDECLCLQVYSMGSNSWHDVKTIPYGLHSPDFSSLVFFNGALHWSGYTRGSTSSDFIFSFDMSNETLVQLPFPEENFKGWESWVEKEKTFRSVGVLGDCLCLCFGISYWRIDIWVMQDYGVRESWAKRLTTRFEVSPSCCKPIWSFENGEILLDARHDLVIYDPDSGKVRNVMPRYESYDMGRGLQFYVESLVPVKPNTCDEVEVEVVVKLIWAKTTKVKEEKPSQL